MKKMLAVLALGVALLLPAALLAEQGDSTLQGTIEQITDDGHVRVAGHSFVVDQDTYITDPARRIVTRGELTPGIQVEVTYFQTSRGEYAKEIVATLMR